ncbi:MAG: hypothetical protein KDC84_04715 [Crocinitomicaceae bacterium]|nr:hypothetical protein [Crocinitomicaceae bacterium]
MKIKIFTIYMIIFSCSLSARAQNLSTENLFNNLHPFWEFLEEVKTEVNDEKGTAYHSVLRQSHNFIFLELEDEKRVLMLRIELQIEHPGKLVKNQVYCRHDDLTKKISQKADKLEGEFEWKTDSSNTFKLTQTQINYLKIADRIAAKGNDIHAQPTDFSEVILTEYWIKLEQINRLNSRSLSHRDSYYLRDLKIAIPLFPKEEKHNTEIGIYKIGRMLINFFDGSAKDYKATGDQIRTQIEKEKEAYGQELDHQK